MKRGKILIAALQLGFFGLSPIAQATTTPVLIETEMVPVATETVETIAEAATILPIFDDAPVELSEAEAVVIESEEPVALETSATTTPEELDSNEVEPTPVATTTTAEAVVSTTTSSSTLADPIVLPEPATIPSPSVFSAAEISANAPVAKSDTPTFSEELQTYVNSDGSPSSVIVTIEASADPNDMLETMVEMNNQPNEETNDSVTSVALDSDITLEPEIAEVATVIADNEVTQLVVEIESTEALDALVAESGVVAVQVNKINFLSLAITTDTVGAVAAHSLGHTGAGTAVAILDTGVDLDHPFMGDRVTTGACFSNSGGAGFGTSTCPEGGVAEYGRAAGAACTGAADCQHGTHVAGIAAGSSDTSKGIAPEADIIAINIATELACGSATCLGVYDSDIIAGLEYVATLQEDTAFTTDIAAANLSVGGGIHVGDCDATETATKEAIDTLLDLGVATVVASGNNGFNGGVSVPACISSAVSVGSTDVFGLFVSSFSNSGSEIDFLAPGESVLSSVPGGGFERLSGTSMATPHVAGAFAVLKGAADELRLDDDPDDIVDEIIDVLDATGREVRDFDNGIIRPLIQIDRAFGASVGDLAGVIYDGIFSTTPVSTALPVKALVNGESFVGSVASQADGTFEISFDEILQEGDVVTIYLDEGGVERALTVYEISEFAPSAVDLYLNTVNLVAPSSDELTHADLDTANPGLVAGITDFYADPAGTTTAATLFNTSNFDLRLTNGEFLAEAPITVRSLHITDDGDGDNDYEGELHLADFDLTVSDRFENGGEVYARGTQAFTLTQDTDSGQFTFRSTTDTNEVIALPDFGAIDYHDLNIDVDGTDVYQLQAPLSVTDDFDSDGSGSGFSFDQNGHELRVADSCVFFGSNSFAQSGDIICGEGFTAFLFTDHGATTTSWIGSFDPTHSLTIGGHMWIETESFSSGGRATFMAPRGTTTIGRSLLNDNHSFDANGGTVVFHPDEGKFITEGVLDPTTFHNLSIIASSTAAFGFYASTTIEGEAYFAGPASSSLELNDGTTEPVSVVDLAMESGLKGRLLAVDPESGVSDRARLASTATSSAVVVDFTGTVAAATQLAVKNLTANSSNGAVAIPINPANSTNLGGTVGWFFDPTLVVSPTEVTVTEAETATITVEITAPPTTPVTVTYNSLQTDIASTSGTLTFTTENYATPQTFTVTGVDNATVDGDRFATIALTVDTTDPDYSTVADQFIAVMVLDNDVVSSGGGSSGGGGGGGSSRSSYEVETATPSLISATSAVLRAKLIDDDGHDDWTGFFAFSDSDRTPSCSDEDILYYATSIYAEGDTITYTISDLTPETTYYYRGCVERDDDDTDGGIESFTTLELGADPVVPTPQVLGATSDDEAELKRQLIIQIIRILIARMSAERLQAAGLEL